MTDPGVIDITDTVSSMQETFVKSGTAYLKGLILAGNVIPGLGAIGMFLFKLVLDPIVSWALKSLAEWVVMKAFFMNTLIRKTGQALDYVEKKNALKALPPTASDAEYEKAELEEIAAFNSCFSVVN